MHPRVVFMQLRRSERSGVQRNDRAAMLSCVVVHAALRLESKDHQMRSIRSFVQCYVLSQTVLLWWFLKRLGLFTNSTCAIVILDGLHIYAAPARHHAHMHLNTLYASSQRQRKARNTTDWQTVVVHDASHNMRRRVFHTNT